jgi:hypothetical protein
VVESVLVRRFWFSLLGCELLREMMTLRFRSMFLVVGIEVIRVSGSEEIV